VLLASLCISSFSPLYLGTGMHTHNSYRQVPTLGDTIVTYTGYLENFQWVGSPTIIINQKTVYAYRYRHLCLSLYLLGMDDLLQMYW
jgi:hypothetical protein